MSAPNPIPTYVNEDLELKLSEYIKQKIEIELIKRKIYAEVNPVISVKSEYPRIRLDFNIEIIVKLAPTETLYYETIEELCSDEDVKDFDKCKKEVVKEFVEEKCAVYEFSAKIGNISIRTGYFMGNDSVKYYCYPALIVSFNDFTHVMNVEDLKEVVDARAERLITTTINALKIYDALNWIDDFKLSISY